METVIGGWIEVGVATRPLSVESESGDAWTVARGNGSAVVAVADGAGHGVAAAEAARRSIAVVEAGGADAPDQLLRKCHDAARGTRGLAMSLASIDPLAKRISWLGVGNVAGFLVRGAPRSRPPVEVLRSGMGIVGDRLPALVSQDLTFEPGDRLILATDGVSGELLDDLDDKSDAQTSAESILQRHATGRDDALVMVARLLKWPS